MTTPKAPRKPREQGVSDKPKKSRKRTPKSQQPTEKTDDAVEGETIFGNVNEPGSGRHEAPPVHGGDQTNEWPR